MQSRGGGKASPHFESMRRGLRELGFLLLLCLPGPALRGQVQPKPAAGDLADALIKEGLQAYQAGRLEDALRKMEQARKAAPDNPFARLYLGLMLYEKDPAEPEAQRLMESVLARFPANPDLHLRLLDSYLRSKKGAEAAELIARSQELMEGNPRLGLNVIYTLIRYDAQDLARRELDSFSRRLSAKPDSGATPEDSGSLGEIRFIQGLIAAGSNRKDEALRLFQEADRLAFPPQKSVQMRMLAEALYRLEEFRLSAQAYQVYLTHFPQDIDARLQLALAYLATPSFARAQQQLEQALATAPGTPQVNYFLGLVLLELKKNDEARQHFQRELELDPGSYQAMAQLALVAYLQGEDERCREWLDKAASLNPNWVETRYVCGLLFNRQGKYGEAILNLESAVAQAPGNMKARLQLSIAYLRSGNEAKANEHREIYERLMNDHKAKSLTEDARRK